MAGIQYSKKNLISKLCSKFTPVSNNYLERVCELISILKGRFLV